MVWKQLIYIYINERNKKKLNFCGTCEDPMYIHVKCNVKYKSIQTLYKTLIKDLDNKVSENSTC